MLKIMFRVACCCVCGLLFANAGHTHDKMKGAILTAEHIRTVIVQNDVDGFIKFLPEGIFVVDTPYVKKEIVDLLRDNNSWLYVSLFSGDKSSVKSYFLAAENLRIDVLYSQDAPDFPTVIYKSSNFDSKDWKRCTLRHVKGKWMLADLFTD